MGFADGIRQSTQKIETKSRAVFVGTVMAAHESITVGSPITGAPGQPVDEGILLTSFTADIQGDVGIIATDAPHAPSNEDGIARPGGGPYVQRSPVGGRHSVALTVAGLSKLLADQTRKLSGT